MNSFYKGKTVLVTGHTGFKGSWLSIWLNSIGARVIGLSLDIPTSPSNFEASSISSGVTDLRLDVRDLTELSRVIEENSPDVIFHLAAQALVKKSHENPVETITTNAVGSMNILEALRNYDKEVTVVMITSDKAYDNVEWTWGYRENDKLGGKDIYSASKGMAELAIKGYVASYFRKHNSVKIGIGRAGNVIGGGDWASDRIVPDCMRSWSKGVEVEIRSPAATRPWQHVLEPLSGYLLLGKMLSEDSGFHGEAFNFGPPSSQDYSVRELIDEMARHWDNILWKDISDREQDFHEAGLLKLNCDKALALLRWKPVMTFEETVEMTVSWYRNYYQEDESGMYDVCVKQIKEFCKLAHDRGIKWSHD